MVSAVVFAKRPAPEPVPVIVSADVEYSVPHWSFENGTTQNGGVIQARDVHSKLVLWRKLIYRASYIPGLETDVQDVFITLIEFKDGAESLLITNEIGAKYGLLLNTQEVVELFGSSLNR